MGDKSRFVAHLLKWIKDFVLEQLRLGFTVFQIMAKHRQNVEKSC
jgi:hypothetical protein